MPSPDRALVLSRVSEAEFQAHVLKMAELLGWRVYHTHDSRRSPSGFPDLVMVRRSDKRIIFAELKRKGANTTAEQRAWLNDLEWCEAETYLWWPDDIDRVAEVLA